MARSRKPSLPISDVDSEVQKIGRSVCKLVSIAAAHPSDTLAFDAAQSLLELGTLPVSPVAQAIERVPDPIRRRMLVHLLQELPPAFEIESALLLLRMGAADPSEEVRAVAKEVSPIRRQRTRDWFNRMAEVRKTFTLLRDQAGVARSRQAESGSAGHP